MITINTNDVLDIRDACRLIGRLLRNVSKLRTPEGKLRAIRPELIESYRRVWASLGAAAGSVWHEDMYESGELRWGMTDLAPEPGTKARGLTKPKQRRLPFLLKSTKGAVVITSRARTSQVATRWGVYIQPDPGGMSAIGRVVVFDLAERVAQLWGATRIRT